jgi:GT2 family glycosyltransferase
VITYVIPTRDRPERLGETLRALGMLRGHEGEVIVIDNASREPADPPRTLQNGLPVRLLRMEQNMGAAARNWGVQLAEERSEWVVMLDDDSHPVGDGLFAALADAPADVAAVMADVFLPNAASLSSSALATARRLQRSSAGAQVGFEPDARACGRSHCCAAQSSGEQWHPSRESGGLPEVFVGCGVAIRRRAFLEAGGYDAAFGYYAEEYDLSAKLLMRGWRVAFDPRFVVHHHKVMDGRDMDLILERLVRNNGWVLQRYAPESERRELLRDMRRRYRAIAQKEGALAGYARGVAELRRTITEQPRIPMSRALFDRFTGLGAARQAIRAAMADAPFATAAIVDAGKNEWCVRAALREAGVRVLEDGAAAEALVIGTMSPGPILDALSRWTRVDAGKRGRLIAPWFRARARGVALERVA